MKKIKMITRLEQKQIIETLNELLDDLNNKGIIVLEDTEIIKVDKESDTSGI